MEKYGNISKGIIGEHMSYYVKSDKCVSCGFCEFLCPFDAIKVNTDTNEYTIDHNLCTSCGMCSEHCPIGAIVPDVNTKVILSVRIDETKCNGCSLCSRRCVAHAITGVVKQPFTIVEERCIKCGVCLATCKRNSIIVEYKK